MFFDDHPRFLDTSEVAADRDRLNLRHEAIFGQRPEIFDGARVLDIASHDGRWTLSALEAGATHVVGVEARAELTAHATETLATYGASPERYRIVNQDIFEYLATTTDVFDVVMCLGFLYHTLRMTELLHGIARLAPAHLVMDTRTAAQDGPVIRLHEETFDIPHNAVADPYAKGNRVLTGTPSPMALEMMLGAYDFRVTHKVDWAALAAGRNRKVVPQYLKGKRVTWFCEPGPPGAPTVVRAARRPGARRGRRGTLSS